MIWNDKQTAAMLGSLELSKLWLGLYILYAQDGLYKGEKKVKKNREESKEHILPQAHTVVT